VEFSLASELLGEEPKSTVVGIGSRHEAQLHTRKLHQTHSTALLGEWKIKVEWNEDET